MNVVIFATSYFPLTGGAQIAIDEISKRNKDINFTLFCPKLQKGLPVNERINNVDVHRIGIGLNIDKFLFSILAPLSVIRQAGRRCIIWAVMANYGAVGALFYHYLTLKKNPFVLTLQEGATLEYIKSHAGIFYFLIKKIVRTADFLQVISSYLLDIARDMGFKGECFKIVPNGVDINRFKPNTDTDALDMIKAKLKISNQNRILFTASRLSEKNGIGDVVEAMIHLPENYIFLIAGTGELEEDIREKIKSNNLENRVILLGNCPHDEIINYLSISHIFIRPSIREGLGNAFLEAMAMGVPVIGTLVGGIKDFLTPGETGIPAIPGNIASIVKAIKAYDDQNLYNKIKENGIKLVHDKFNWDIIGGQFREMIISLK